MPNLMQNYGIFTKVTVFQEFIENEAKRERKGVEMTKAGNNQCHDTSMYLAT